MFIDMHCDSASGALFASHKTGIPAADLLYHNPEAHLDISRLAPARAMAQFFACFVPKPEYYTKAGITNDRDFVTQVLQVVKDAVYAHYDQIRITTSAEQMRFHQQQGLVSAFLTLEEGRPVDGKLENIDWLYDQGIRLITLTWNYINCFGHPNSRDPKIMQAGLTDFGKEAIQYMNDKGIIVDVSHLSDGGFYDVAALAKKPFVASHSCSRSLCDHPRNMTDEMIRILADKGGVIGLNFNPPFVSEAEVTTLDLLTKHAKHIADVGGIDCVALGSDFDGIDGNLEINNVSMMPQLLDRLQAAGFSAMDVEKIAYKNTERVLLDTL